MVAPLRALLGMMAFIALSAPSPAASPAGLQAAVGVATPLSAPPAIASPTTIASPCDPGEDDRASELCAQWKAADAADSAADTAWIVGLLGVAIGAFTLGAAAVAAYYAKDTVTHARRGNEIAESVQRPWVTIDIKAMGARRQLPGAMHFRFEVIARNVGQRPATHFSSFAKLMFFGQADNYASMKPRLMAQLNAWLDRARPPAGNVLAPNGAEISPYWESFTAPEMNVSQVVGINVAVPVLLCAVSYRSEIDPTITQIAWRTVRLNSVNPAGDAVTLLYLDRDSGPSELSLFRLTGSRHETRPAREYDDTVDC